MHFQSDGREWRGRFSPLFLESVNTLLELMSVEWQNVRVGLREYVKGEYLTVSSTVSICDTITIYHSVCDRFLALGRGLVGLNVEVDEQDEVTRKQDTTEDSSRFCPSARAEVGKVREAVGSIVRVGYEIPIISNNASQEDLTGNTYFRNRRRRGQ